MMLGFEAGAPKTSPGASSRKIATRKRRSGEIESNGGLIKKRRLRRPTSGNLFPLLVLVVIVILFFDQHSPGGVVVVAAAGGVPEDSVECVLVGFVDVVERHL